MGSPRLDVSVVFSRCWNPEEVGSNAEGINLMVRMKASRQRTKGSFFHVLYIGCPQKKAVQIQRIFLPQKIWITGGSPHFKRTELRKKLPHRYP